ncbi:Spy/CpxP family protein refolding chaperone [Oxalicibacterium faecigallinarum]|uniref:Membrane protein n=1 Tax=Oxalicibacterium faecigallinarum TaxID=573741 RepID=A0A8J3AVF9_9BURK|nr:Spy/CpxP family protein refolding chaperone [Oxalicibacterium faecigallinarum]GGI19802.1 membrane protein [Oxalicibacterium faecigallinarum]
MNNQQARNNAVTIADQTSASARGRRLLIAGATAAIVGSMSLIGVSHAQVDQKPVPTAQQKQERHGDRDERMSPEKAEKRFDRMLERLVPDASAEQKTKLKAISQSAFKELHPLHEKARDAREQRMKLLSAPTIDRAAIEKARAAEQQLADQRSRIVTKAFTDAAEVLTPAQRVKAAEQMKKHRKHFGEHGLRHGGKFKPGSDQAPPAAPKAP